MKWPGRKRAGEAESRGLALVPLVVAGLLFFLLVPRGTPPSEIPLPPLDGPALAAVHGEDARAAAAAARGLPADVRAVGTRLEALHEQLDTETPDVRAVDSAASAIADEVLRIRGERGAEEGLRLLVTLRAVQLRDFLTAVGPLRDRGEITPELLRLAAPLVRKLVSFGWIHPRRCPPSGGAGLCAVGASAGEAVLPTDDELAVLYKRLWNTETGLAPSLSPARGAPEALPGAEAPVERTLLHRLNLRVPHPETASLARFALARAAAKTAAEREKVEEDVALSAERFRIAKLGEVARDTPGYPLDYALGVAYGRAHDYEHAAEALLRFTEAHPSGDYTLRARHHLAYVLRQRDR